MERPKPRRHVRQIERGGTICSETICSEWIAVASIRWVRPGPNILQIKTPKKKTSSPNRKAGTRASLSKPAIVAAAAKLIESVGANGFSLRKLAKALGVGPTTIHFHFEGGVGSVFSAVAQEALVGVTRPFKPKDEMPPPLPLASPAQGQ